MTFDKPVAQRLAALLPDPGRTGRILMIIATLMSLRECWDGRQGCPGCGAADRQA